MMDRDNKKEIIAMQRLKDKSKRQNNMRLVAEYANTLGNLYFQQGDIQAAISEHETEFMACEVANDVCGQAVAARKQGECYLELSEFDKAEEHFRKYVDLAKVSENDIEVQRSWATYGRYYLTKCSTLPPRTRERKICEKKAQQSFMKSLRCCDELKGTIESTEFYDMRARCSLNLGLLSNVKNEEKEAIENIKNAILLSRRHSLHETLILASYNLADLYSKVKKFVECLHVIDDAMKSAAKVEFKQKLDMIRLQAQVLVECGDYGVALEKVKAEMRKHIGNEREEIKPTAVKLYKIITCLNKLPVSNDETKYKLYESLGDLCSGLSAFYKANEFYEQTLHMMNQLEVDHVLLTPILSSLAQTHMDVKDYVKAIEYYCSEVKIQRALNNNDQAARSLLNMAACMENNDTALLVIAKCYEQARLEAIKAKEPKLELLILKIQSESMKQFELDEEYEKCLTAIAELKRKHDITESQEELETQPDDSISSSDGGFELSEDSDDEHDSEVVTSALRKNFKILRNELGETKLHQAVIKGKTDVVIDLIKKGHPLDIRDHAGWIPLHEAANHNRVEIAQLLIQKGSNVNDRGGDKCGGITPLHDACASGHTAMIELLIDSGANVIAKEDENRYPLDELLDYREKNDEKLTEEEKTELDEVEEMIRTRMRMKGITPKSKPFKEQQANRDVLEDLPALKNTTKQKATDDDGNVSDNSQDSNKENVRPTMVGAYSPELTATELYRSAVANVRKSAKRLPVARYSTTERGNDSKKSSALIPSDRDDVNVAAKSDWLVDDFVSSPVKKKQRTSTEKQKSKKSRKSLESSLPAMSPTTSLRSRSPCLNDSGSQSSNDDEGSENSDRDDPVVPIVDDEPASSGKSKHDDDFEDLSQLLQRPTFDTHSSRRSKSDHNKIRSSGENSAANHQSDVNPAEQDIIDLISGKTCNTPSELDTQILNRSFQSIFSQELDTDETLRAFDDVKLPENNRETPTDQILETDNDGEDKSGLDSPIVSAIKPVTSTNEKTDNGIQEAKSKKCRRSIQTNIIDDIIADNQKTKDEVRTKKQLQTSTPIRPVPILEQADQRTPAVTLAANETRDSGFPIEPAAGAFKSMRTESDNSSSLLNVSMNSRTGGDNTSFNQPALKVLCQWKGRILLIPIPRRGETTIGWLIDEFIKRLSRSRACNVKPPLAQDILLTRAADGAELFNEDLITDVLADNEKVAAVHVDDL